MCQTELFAAGRAAEVTVRQIVVARSQAVADDKPDLVHTMRMQTLQNLLEYLGNPLNTPRKFTPVQTFMLKHDNRIRIEKRGFH